MFLRHKVGLHICKVNKIPSEVLEHNVLTLELHVLFYLYLVMQYLLQLWFFCNSVFYLFVNVVI